MKKMNGLFAGAPLLLIVVVACGGKEERTALEPMPENPPAASVASSDSSIATPELQYASTLSSILAADKFSTQGGELVGGKLVNNGRAGYLLYGPYIPLQAGNYTVALKGNIEALPAGKVHLDVASSKGKIVHGSHDVTTTGQIPNFEVSIAENVRDLEVRVLVPGGSEVSIESYQVLKKN